MRLLATAELRARSRMIGGLAAGAFTYLLILALTYRTFAVGGLEQSFGGGGARKAISAFSGSHGADVFSPHGWMGLGFNHPMLMVTSLTVALAIGTGAVAGEVESGRTQLLFTAPMARTRFVGAALAAWLVAEVAVLVAALGGAVAGALLSHDLRAAGIAPLVWAPLQLLPLTLLVVAVAVLASVLSDTRGRALGVASGAIIAAYLVSVVSGLSDSLDWLRWVTPFGYYDPGAAISHGLRPWPALVLVAGALLLLGLASRILERRDLA